MTTIWLLMALLLLSYLGSFLVGDHVLRGFGLSSGAEYLVLGFLLGPHVLGLVERSTLSTFEPLADVAVGWLALVVGLSYGFVGRRRIRNSHLLFGFLMAIASGVIIAGAVFYYLTKFTPLRGPERLLLAAGVGAACSETTRHVVRWVVERYGAKGPLSTLLAEIADSDDMVPILATAVLFSFQIAGKLSWHIPFAGWTGATLALGLILGVLTAVLLGKDFRLDESWGVLLGTSLLTIGLAARIGLSPLAPMFVLGVTINALSRHRLEVWAMVNPTERPVILPVFLLAGARIDLQATHWLPWIIGVALAARIIAKGLSGVVLRAFAPSARPAGALLGFGLISSGALAICIGLAFSFRFPGPIGDSILAVASAVTIFGEFLGPSALRSSLRAVGEIEDSVPSKKPLSIEITAIPPDTEQESANEEVVSE